MVHTDECDSADDCHRGSGCLVSITFDDAFANLLENALPVLERYQISAVVFAVTENLGSVPKWRISADHPEAGEVTMTTEQLQAVAKNPLIRIGSHTQSHPELAKLSGDEVHRELAESKVALEKLVGYAIEDLALPHGSFNDEVLTIARAVGYKRIYTLEPCAEREFQSDGRVGRFLMSPDVWRSEFMLTCAGGYSWLYRFRKLVHRICCR